MRDYSKYIGEKFTDENGEVCRVICGKKIVQSDNENLNRWANEYRVDKHIEDVVNYNFEQFNELKYE